ncbi:NAD(P)(+) transhydrogenase (Re/Si-specific) subunit beta [Paraburkholderia sediminicola]|uniref:NAD(P)(+) transhydrogenase (Re/Si-specific) subunit beta n=1 Tax=Paraburkholderia rhynchosiae TaxID=487049 RepID=A0ACC7N891_9BURK
MLQTSDSTAWMSVFLTLAAALATALVSVLTVALAAVGQRLLYRGSTHRPYWHGGALAAVLAGLLAAGTGASDAVIEASVAGAVFGAWLVRGCDLTRRPGLIMLLGSGMGLAVMSGGIVRYLSAATGRANAERIELYGAVFIGALIFATCAIALCKLRGALQLNPVTRPGHRIVNLLAMLLCAWLGYSFVTEQAQPFGLAALLAMSALACSLGVHLMISREYSAAGDVSEVSHALHVHAFAARCGGLALDRRGLLAQIEWHGGEEPAWTLRETGTLRASAYRYRRGGHDGASVTRRQRMRASHRPTHFVARR